MRFAATQALYRKYTILKENTVDLSAVPCPTGRGETFVLSSKEPLKFQGADLIQETPKNGFINYELKPLKKQIILK